MHLPSDKFRGSFLLAFGGRLRWHLLVRAVPHCVVVLAQTTSGDGTKWPAHDCQRPLAMRSPVEPSALNQNHGSASSYVSPHFQPAKITFLLSIILGGLLCMKRSEHRDYKHHWQGASLVILNGDRVVLSVTLDIVNFSMLGWTGPRT